MKSAAIAKMLVAIPAICLVAACTANHETTVKVDESSSTEAARPDIAQQSEQLKAALRSVDEFKTPGIDCELSGIYPHAENPDWYYVVANMKPPYRYGQKPKLPEKYRGKLLTVNRHAEILESMDVADDDFGGLAFADGHLFVALTNDASLVKINLDSGEQVGRYPLSSPAGGLAYDTDREVLIAQLYTGHPHLAVIDPTTGETLETLWSDESAMGLAKVDGDWLCTWASGWDPGSLGELRVLDQTSGKVRSRIQLDRIHSCLAPVGNGENAFLSLVTLDDVSGELVVRKYHYTGERNWPDAS